MNRPQIMEM